MPWLKYQASHAHGLGPAEYIEFDRADAVPDLEDEIRAQLYDGIRSPKFEILERLPPEVMDAKVEHAQRQAEFWTKRALHLNMQRGVRIVLESSGS